MAKDKQNKNEEILAESEKKIVDDLVKDVKSTETQAEVSKESLEKKKVSRNPYDKVLELAEKTVVKKDKHYACIMKGLPRAYISAGPFTIPAFSAKLVDTGTGWMELSAPTPGAFYDYTTEEAEQFVEEVKSRVVVWSDPQKMRCTIYKHNARNKVPGASAEPLAKYIVFEAANDMTAEQVLSPEQMKTMYEKAEQ